MPRPALKNVSTAALHAEIQKRVQKLDSLLKLRDDVDQQIAELQALAGQFGKAAPVVQVVKAGRKRGRKPSAVKPAAKKAGKRSQDGQTASEFILGLVAGGKVLTSAELAQAWAAAGRKGMVAKTLGEMVAKKKLTRRKLRGQRGSNYKLPGSAGREAKTVAAKPAAKKPAAKLVPRKAKKTFTCPTCRKVFASGMLLGSHYKAELTHRQK